MADQGLFVVVTIAPNGIIHVWGSGPVVDPKGEEVVPFTERADARREADRFRREDRLAHGDDDPLVVTVCKLLGTTPVPVD